MGKGEGEEVEALSAQQKHTAFPGREGRLFSQLSVNLPANSTRYASPAGLGFSGSNFATWTLRAIPSLASNQIPQKLGSISYHLRPWRAETGCA